MIRYSLNTKIRRTYNFTSSFHKLDKQMGTNCFWITQFPLLYKERKYEELRTDFPVRYRITKKIKQNWFLINQSDQGKNVNWDWSAQLLSHCVKSQFNITVNKMIFPDFPIDTKMLFQRIFQSSAFRKPFKEA